MQWHSVSEFLSMDGYGLYIWGAYGLTLLCMLLEPGLAVWRRRRAWQAASQQEEQF